MSPIERAADAVKAVMEGSRILDPRRLYASLARAAILAFLEGVDPDDIGCALAPSHDEDSAVMWGDRARNVLASLRSLAEEQR